MKTIRQLQYEKVRQLYQELYRHRGEGIAISDISTISDELLHSTSREPLSGNYRLPVYDTVDIDALNAELGLIATDAEVIYEFLDLYGQRINMLEFINDVWSLFSSHRARNAMLRMAKYTAPLFIPGFTQELDIMDVADHDVTTLNITEQGYLTVPVVSNQFQVQRIRDDDVSVNRIGSGLSATVEGKPADVFRRGMGNELLMYLEGNTVQNAGFVITANIEATGVNLITLRLGEEENGIRVTVETTSDRKKYQTIYQAVTTHEYIEIGHDGTDIAQIRITMEMSTPNIVHTDKVRYEFSLYNVSLLSANKKKGGVYQTTMMEVDEGIGYISLAAEDEKLGNVNVNYYIATSESDTESPEAVGFTKVDTDDGSLIMFGNRVTTIDNITTSGNSWDLTPLKRYGSKLYNIFGGGFTGDFGDFSIADGVISGEVEIISDSIKLHRGVGDYIFREISTTETRSVKYLPYDTVMDDDVWVKPLALKTTIRELVMSSNIGSDGGVNNVLYVDHILLNPEFVQVERDDGVSIPVAVIDSGEDTGYGSYYITFEADGGNAVFSDEYNYYVTYVVDLLTYAGNTGRAISLDGNSFSITCGEDTLEHGVDFIVHFNGLKVELLRTGKYMDHYGVDRENGVNYSDPVNIAFSYEESSSAGSQFWETWVYVDDVTTISIIPFTSEEINAGNFHRIDGKLVSTTREHTLGMGWHQIQTTQPFPTVNGNGYDTNMNTDASSNAGIIIPPDVAKQRVFKDSMRQVSPYRLTIMSPGEAKSCFAYENGKILISFIPDYIDSLLLTQSHLVAETGREMLCKKPVLDVDYINTGYTAQPEIFTMEFAYRTLVNPRYFYVKAEIEVSGPDDSAVIRKIGINKYKEV